MAGQAEAPLDKLDRLLRLRRLPAADKHLALMFWNHPRREERRRLASQCTGQPGPSRRALRAAGYRVATSDESALIDTAQRLLGGYHRPQTLDALYRDGLAASLPLDAYLHWFEALPADLREEMRALGASPRRHWTLRDIDGQRRFDVPGGALGNLLLLPQPPRAGRPGEAYHDSAVPPDHLYLAVYQFVREGFWRRRADPFRQPMAPRNADSGKDRGLAVGDYPLRALGDLPVFYPYIQDNVGEAIQARRRGRAVTVSHQTPSFAPAGLYDELRDLHQLIHEYQQLDEGAVREAQRRADPRGGAGGAHERRPGLERGSDARGFPAFLGVLHDHLHRLAGSAMPLGQHSFGVAAVAGAAPGHHRAAARRALLPRALGLDPDELFAADFRALREGRAYRTPQRATCATVARSPRWPIRACASSCCAPANWTASPPTPANWRRCSPASPGASSRPGRARDPIRNPQVPSGRNLLRLRGRQGTDPRRLRSWRPRPSANCWKATAPSTRAGRRKSLAFSLWSSETMRHLGIVEARRCTPSACARAGTPVATPAGAGHVPAAELGRPRVDVVLQVTSVYRDQFDGFMRLLAEAIERLAALDEPGNPLARNSQALERRLR